MYVHIVLTVNRRFTTAKSDKGPDWKKVNTFLSQLFHLERENVTAYSIFDYDQVYSLQDNAPFLYPV